MKQFLMLLAMVTSLSCHAQFSSSETVYCYKYEYTSNDGIKYRESSMSESYYFVNFQNDMMGYSSDSGLKRIRQRILEDPSYYEDAAINNLAYNYSRWKTQPDFVGSYFASVSILQYNEDFSTYSKYTYRSLNKSAQSNIMAQQAWWGEAHWGSRCFTFTTDRSEMIIWNTSDPENRDYYKRINISELTPNTDFLY